MQNEINNTDYTVDTIVSNKGQIKKFAQICAMLPIKLGCRVPVIAVLRLNGVIGRVSNIKSGLSLEGLNKLIEKAFALPKLQAVCLCINSPGGSPVQAELIAQRIASLSEKKEVPVYSFVEDMAVSGGYWLACAGKEIYASRSSVIGSIGVISSNFGLHEAISKLGIERRIYAEGKNKSVLDPFQPVKTSDVKIIKQLQKHVYNHFVDYVKTRRANKLTQSDDVLFNGEFWAGESACDFGLIDGIKDVYSFITEKFGDDVRVEQIASKQSMFKKFFRGEINTSCDYITHEIVDYALDQISLRLLYNRFDLY